MSTLPPHDLATPDLDSTPPRERPANPAPVPRPSGSGARRVIGLGLVGLAILIGVGVVPKLSRRAELQSAQASLGLPRLVTYAQARVGEASGKVVLPGTASPIETAMIYARTNGFVRDIKVDIGDRVKSGDLLAVLDAPEMESDSRSARARAGEAALNAKIVRAVADRQARLAQEGVGTLAAADEAEARANSAAAAQSTTRSEVERWNTMLSFRQVRAPFSGVITRRNVEKGSLVTAGSSAGVASLFEIARTETLKVTVDVPQSLAQHVKIGDTTQVISGTLTVEGIVARTAGALDPSLRTLRTEVHIPGDKGILAGSFVRVALKTVTTTPPVNVPANTLVARPGGNVVYVVNSDNKVEERKVTLGRELGAEVELLTGLTGTEKVITNPAESLVTGETVRLAEKKPPPGASGSASASAAVGTSVPVGASAPVGTSVPVGTSAPVGTSMPVGTSAAPSGSQPPRP